MSRSLSRHLSARSAVTLPTRHCLVSRCLPLRSPISTYLLIMTGYSVIGERTADCNRGHEAFPFCAPEQHPDPNVASRIVAEVATTIDRLADIPEWQHDRGYAEARQALDELFFDYFRLSLSDRLLVQDVVVVVASSIQPADYSRLATPLLNRPSASEVSTYIDILAHELEAWRTRSGGSGGLSVEGIVDGTNSFFGAVRIGLRGRGRDATGLVRSESAFQRLLETSRLVSSTARWNRFR